MTTPIDAAANLMEEVAAQLDCATASLIALACAHWQMDWRPQAERPATVIG